MCAKIKVERARKMGTKKGPKSKTCDCLDLEGARLDGHKVIKRQEYFVEQPEGGRRRATAAMLRDTAHKKGVGRPAPPNIVHIPLRHPRAFPHVAHLIRLSGASSLSFCLTGGRRRWGGDRASHGRAPQRKRTHA